jgi:hypothetical protein
MALAYDQIDAHVQKHIIPVLANNVFVGDPFQAKLLSKSKIMLDGGKTIAQPIQYGYHAGGSFKGLDKFDINPVTTRTLGEWEYRSNYVNITLTGDDIDKCEGSDGFLGLVKSEVAGAEQTIRHNLSTQLFGDGTGNNSKDWNGLKDAIGTGSYGGIAPADVSSSTTDRRWEGYVWTTGGSITPALIKTFMGEVTYGTEVPDLMCTTQTLYDSLWAQCQPQQRFLNPASTLAKLGFTGIEIDGMQILVDRHCPTGYAFGINTDYWHMVIHRNKNFKWTANKELIDADGYVRQILLKGNFFTVGRRYNFKASSLTA